MKRRRFVQGLAMAFAAAAARAGAAASEGSKALYSKLADEVEAALRRDVLGAWFPRCVDRENGGFCSEFGRDWRAGKSAGKFSVFQGRMTWIAAQTVVRRPDLKEQFLPYVHHGAAYLMDVLWDKEHGGFFWGLDDKGHVSPPYTENKHLYGMSFALYGAAAAYQATKDAGTLDLAQRAFRWIDGHAHDAANGGYFEWLTRDGKIVEAHGDPAKLEGVAVAAFPVGYKSMNTHIHLLESFSQLYEVWKDDTLRRRLEEMIAIVRDRIAVEPGVLNLYLTPDWRAIPDHDSYGHDIEAAYLLLEAEDVLGRGHDPRTEAMARKLVDHALAYGWDEASGGFFDDGTTFGPAEKRDKVWWVQMEGLNALLLMHDEYGAATDVYFNAFLKQWQFITNHQIDPEFHGLFPTIGPDGAPVADGKGSIWKAAYHDGRAFLNVSERLRRLGEATR